MGSSIQNYWAGPLLGAIIGAIGGVTGILCGLILGFLLQQFLGRFSLDRKIARYFETPGKIGFNEGVPGLAAYCALGTIIVSRSAMPAEFIADWVIRSAIAVFPGSSPAFPLITSFCRIALSMTDRLNPDLLAESLAARRSGMGDLKLLGRELESLALGERALKEAVLIRRTLDPGYTPGKSPAASLPPSPRIRAPSEDSRVTKFS
jgi:DnaJ like chaperone protein